VPLAAGIPVTHRGLARQVTVLAGHDAHGVVAADWAALARSDGTLVVLMGVSALPEITAALLDHRMSPDVPVAIIENGCTAEQRVTTGALRTIAELARRRGVVSPAVIVVGAVAAFTAESG
jgi:uroporphyrin-III C-methyltransferase/precorrin-2 dehydrogenase/sirohydrochlorin ferrochelatase